MSIMPTSRLSAVALKSVILLLLSASLQRAPAQQAGVPDPAGHSPGSVASALSDVPTVLVLQLPVVPQPGGRALVIRQRTGVPRDLIVLPAQGATGADLASALAALTRARERDKGPLEAAQVRISIRSTGFAQTPPAAENHFIALLDRLRRAPERKIDGVGTGPAIVVPQPRATRP